MLVLHFIKEVLQWVVGVYLYIQLVVLFMLVSGKNLDFLFLNISILVCLERWLSEKFSLKTLYFLGYFVYAIGCVVNFFVHEIAVNITMCVTCKFIFYLIYSFHLSL
jgi:Na+/melibiose symporter-like transporter